jgi:hypothetical protein
MFLDDGLGIEKDDELCKAVVNQVKCDLINSGFVNWCSNNVTTETYVTGITIYNTLTRFICATMFNIHVSNKLFTIY